MPRRTHRFVAGTAAFALAFGLLMLTDGTATAATASGATSSGTRGDFNGDGYLDIAAAAQDATINGQSQAGAVAIAYGSPDGAGAVAASRVTLTQDSPGIGGVPEVGDHFGAALTVGDFDGDGYSDLAVGTSGEDVTGDVDAGLVQILWGSATGLSGATTLPEPGRFDHDAHGQALAAGDFNGDGKIDLATGNTSAQAWLYEGGFTRSGDTGGTYPLGYLNTYNFEVDSLTSGDLNGDGSDDLMVSESRIYLGGGDDAATLGLTLYGDIGYGAEYSSVFGDFDHDGYGDIVIGGPGDHGGEFTYLPGGPASQSDPSWQIDTGREYTLTQADFGVPGEAGSNDRFGAGLASGDINGDGYDDLAVGDPMEDVGSVADTGFVLVMYGGSNGLTNNEQVFEQSTAGVPGADEVGDDFGSQALLSDVNGDGKDDLTVAVGNENGGNGALVVLPSGGETVTPAGARALTDTSFALPTAGQPHLGSALR